MTFDISRFVNVVYSSCEMKFLRVLPQTYHKKTEEKVEEEE